MKKYTILIPFFLVLTGIFGLCSCKEHLPVVGLTVTSKNGGYPGEVEVSTTGTQATKKRETINHYQLLVTDPKGLTESYAQSNGKFPVLTLTVPGQHIFELIVSDTEGQSVSARKELTIKDPFEGFCLDTTRPELTEGEGYTEESPIRFTLDFAEAGYRQWISRLAFELTEVDGNGNPVEGGIFFADELDVDIEDEIVFDDGVVLKGPEPDAVEKSYMLYVTPYDRYGNAGETVSARFYVKDKNAPQAALVVFGEVPSGDNPKKTEFKINGDGELSLPVYEYSTVWFSASGSTATGDESDTETGLSAFEYKLYALDEKDERYFYNGASPAAAEAEAVFDLGSAGRYEIELTVTNTLGLSDTKTFAFDVVENTPYVTSVDFNGGDTIYEALEYLVTVKGASPMPDQGKITWATVTINDTVSDVVYQLPVRSADTDATMIWTAFVWDLQDDKEYSGSVTVENAAGRVSEPKPFTVYVRDNTPQISMTVTPSVQIINFDEEMTIVTSPVLKEEWDKGSLKLSVSRSQEGGTAETVSDGLSEVAVTPDPENAENVILSWTLTPKKMSNDNDVSYAVSLVLENGSGYSEARKVFTATTDLSFLTFDVQGLASSALRKYYAGESVRLDATGSRKNGNPVADFSAFKWKVEIDGETNAYVDNNTGVGGDRLTSNGDGTYNLLLGQAGYYTITLTNEDGDTVNRLILVENMTPTVSDIQFKEIPGEGMSRPVGTKTAVPGQIMELMYEITANATIPDGSPIEYDWYVDSLPAVAGTNPDALEEVTSDGKTVRTFLAPGEHRIYVIAKKQGSGENASRPVYKDIVVEGLKGPVVEAVSPYTNNLKPSWTVQPDSASNADQFRYQIQKSGVPEDDGEWKTVDELVGYTSEHNLDGGDHTNGYVLYVQRRSTADGRWSDSGYGELFVDTEAPDALPVITVAEDLTVENPDDANLRITNDGKASNVWSWALPAESEELKAIRYTINTEDVPENEWIWNEAAATSAAPSPSTVDFVGENSDRKVVLAVQVQDLAGNWSESYASSAIRIDRLAPPSPVNDGTAEWINNRALEFKWKAGDDCEALQGWKVELAGTEEADDLSADTLTWSASSQMPETPDTSYSLSVYAVDLAGNVSVPVNISQRLDTVAPEAPTDLVLIDGAGTDNAGKNTDNFEFSYTAPEGDTVFLVAVADGRDASADDGAFADNADGLSYTVTKTSDSWYTFLVKAVDRAGNKSEAAKMNFYRDATDPAITLQEMLTFNFGDARKTKDEIAAMASVSDFDTAPEITYEYPLADIDGEYTYRQVKGENLMTVKAVDNLGNTSTKTIKLTVNAPTVNAWPGFSADASDGSSLNRSGAYSITKAAINFQYYQLFGGTTQDPKSAAYSPGTTYKVMTNDLGDYDANQMAIGIYDGNIHFIGQRQLSTLQYVRNIAGEIYADPAKTGSAIRLWKGCTYRFTVAYRTPTQDSYIPNSFKLTVCGPGGASDLGSKEVAPNAGQEASVSVDVTPGEDILNPVMKAEVLDSGANDRTGFNLLNFKVEVINWPGK